MDSVFGALSADIKRLAPATGTYTVVVSDAGSGRNGSGSYRLTANGLYDALRVCVPVLSGSGLTLGAVGGTPGATFAVYTSTNVTTPRSEWLPIFTNKFDIYGVSNGVFQHELTLRDRYFYLLQQ